eukprot:scaffold8066_cov157-Isochrysis_galbana.AAC.5
MNIPCAKLEVALETTSNFRRRASAAASWRGRMEWLAHVHDTHRLLEDTTPATISFYDHVELGIASPLQAPPPPPNAISPGRCCRKRKCLEPCS